jgi:hypothetical protein
VTAGAQPEAAPSLGWLVDLERLRQLPQRYARAVDQRDVDALAELFHPDGRVAGTRGVATLPEYLDQFRSATPAFRSSMHLLGEPLIDLMPGAATARMDTYAVVHQLERLTEPGGDLILGIRYVDELVRDDGAWRIVDRTSVILWSRVPPRPQPDD